MAKCSGGLIIHTDGTIAGCTARRRLDGWAGREERHAHAARQLADASRQFDEVRARVAAFDRGRAAP
jgi:hypothetical protein